ncbi:glycosyltransferase [Halorhodospira halochloris]|uniref:glycosyltransferase n=1 Tax=Halorhodospira halochloris TaxID=1052 RepID=UPI001EE96055|nr:glycosyltransferase [Halorhodospira halochloris]MCG5549492.1 glycosyltransferase [Halorhodospira halochloris]
MSYPQEEVGALVKPCVVHVVGKDVPAQPDDGGMPRSVQWLAEAQARSGFDVHVVSPGGVSNEFFTHWAASPFSVDNVRKCIGLVPPHAVLHLHATDKGIDVPVGLVLQNSKHAFIATLRCNHGPGDFPLYNRVYLSASHAQNHDESVFVYNGLPIENYPLGPGGGGYALFLGKVRRRKKGAGLAISVARLGTRVVVAGGRHFKYPETWLPINRNLDIVGVVDGHAKIELLRYADVLLFPVMWDEPFGLVLIEAMAVGTPVVGTRRGSIPEIVEDGVTGITTSASPEALQSAVASASQCDRGLCRQRVVERFSIDRVVTDYSALYNAAMRGEVW